MALDVLGRLPEVLLPWYETHRRDLPWRADREPYHVWLSVIMLQQTRVEAVKGYYDRFLKALPTIEDLAQADDELLHKLWEGLGYYSRVRNLKKAARRICERHGGQFPRSYEDVRDLPGIGDYTAGAICSIAFGQKRAAVDGNVLRVVTRLTEDPTPIQQEKFKTQVRQALEDVYPEDAGAFTQALMELGATVCGPNWAPRCGECPCRAFCGGAIHGTAERFPVKAAKKPRRIEDRTVFILSCEGRYGLCKREDRGLLAGLWQFPDKVGHLGPEAALAAVAAMGLKPRELLRQTERSHVFTHIQWRMRGYYMEVKETAGDLVWYSAGQIEETAALPTAYRQFWEGKKDV